MSTFSLKVLLSKDLVSILGSQGGIPLSAMTRIYLLSLSGPSSLMEPEVEPGVKPLLPSHLYGPN